MSESTLYEFIIASETRHLEAVLKKAILKTMEAEVPEAIDGTVVDARSTPESRQLDASTRPTVS